MKIITVEHLSKYYTIGHDRNSGVIRYKTFRESMMSAGRSLYQRLRHPLSPNREQVELEEFRALDDVSFEVEQGDRIGIIGRNGAGKSTLLKLLCRITEPTKGRITMRGRVASLLEVGTGFHPELSGRENIYLNGAILGMKRAEIKRKFDEIVDFSGVEKFLDTPVKRYSSGMYVRLAFAVAAHLESEILLIDEVLAVGDAEFQKKCLGKMDDISKNEGRTILFVSHNMGAIKNLCNLVLFLKQGRKEALLDKVDEVIAQYLMKPQLNCPLWKNDGSFYDHSFTPEKMYLIDEGGNITNMVSRSRKYNLVIEATINKIDPSLNFGVSILSSSGTIAFSTWIRDLPQGKDLIILGQNRYSFELPTAILNNGKYSILLSAGLDNIRTIIPVDADMVNLSFEVSDNLGLAFGGTVRRGIFFQLIPWERQAGD